MSRTTSIANSRSSVYVYLRAKRISINGVTRLDVNKSSPRNSSEKKIDPRDPGHPERIRELRSKRKSRFGRASLFENNARNETRNFNRTIRNIATLIATFFSLHIFVGAFNEADRPPRSYSRLHLVRLCSPSPRAHRRETTPREATRETFKSILSAVCYGKRFGPKGYGYGQGGGALQSDCYANGWVFQSRDPMVRKRHAQQRTCLGASTHSHLIHYIFIYMMRLSA